MTPLPKAVIVVIQHLCLGGEQRNFLSILRAFKAQGIMTHLIYEHDGELTADFRAVADFVYHMRFPYPSKLKSLRFYLPFRKKLQKIAANLPGVPVFVSDYYPLWAISQALKKFPNPIIAYWQGEFDSSKPHLMIKKWKRYGLKYASRCVLSEPLLKTIKEASLTLPVPVYTLNPFNDYSKFTPSGKEPALLRKKLDIPEGVKVATIIGQVSEAKGQPWLASEFINRKDLYENWHLLIIGPIRDDSLKLFNQLKSKDTQNKLRLLGSREDIPSFLAVSDLSLFPGILEESFGLSVLESVLMEKPIIAFASGTIPQILGEGYPGLVKKGDRAAFVNQWARGALTPTSAIRTRWLSKLDQATWQADLFNIFKL